MPSNPGSPRAPSLRSVEPGTSRSAPAKANEPVFAAAVDAFDRADFAVAGALIAAAAPTTRAQNGRIRLLEAQLARMLGDFPRVAEAARIARLDLAEPSERLLATMLCGIAAKRLGRPEEAAAFFADVERRLGRFDRSAVRYAVYLLALVAWESGDLERAESIARANIAADPGAYDSVALIGWIDVRRERFEPAGRTFLAAIDTLRATGRIDARFHARALHAVASVASETMDLPLGERAVAEYARVAWTDSLRVERFDTLQYLRFHLMQKGELEAASIAARDAIAFATREAFVAIGETNAAVSSRLIGEDRSWRIQLERAWNVLRSTSWRAADDDARVALTNFAIEAATEMPAEARQAVTLYQSLSAKRNPQSGFAAGDRRIGAYEGIAAARVAEVLGRHELAVSEYERALTIWVEIGYEMRAALAALDLSRLTGDSRYDAVVQSALARAPKAWFAPIDDSTSPLAALTPAERTVLVRLLAGKSAKAIAASLGRSHFTINNHTRKIFSAFDVNSRARLLARCVELGITPAVVDKFHP
jgi:DNA-binding CsgD family transcriptional regulator/tetratricopeptide (TPR) repeat protein